MKKITKKEKKVAVLTGNSNLLDVERVCAKNGGDIIYNGNCSRQCTVKKEPIYLFPFLFSICNSICL